MTDIVLSIIAAEDLVNDICGEPDLEATKGPPPNVQPGGPAAEPFTTIVAAATIVLAAAKIVEATIKIAGLIRKQFPDSDPRRQTCIVTIAKENGDVHRLLFDKNMSRDKIAETLRDHIEG